MSKEFPHAHERVKMKGYPYDDDRIEGMDAIRKTIDPLMSKRFFYRKWRPLIEHIICEYPHYWRRNPPIRYFTFKRYLHAVILDHCRPSHSKRSEIKAKKEGKKS